MGTAFGVCFGYWIGGAAFFYSVSFMCNTHLTFLQILSLSVSPRINFCSIPFAIVVTACVFTVLAQINNIIIKKIIIHDQCHSTPSLFCLFPMKVLTINLLYVN